MSREINQESVEKLLLETIASLVEDKYLLGESVIGKFPRLEAVDTLSQAYQRIKSVNK